MSERPRNPKLNKVIERLIAAVGYEVSVIRRNQPPEAAITGILDGFHLGTKLISVDSKNVLNIINLDDVSVIRIYPVKV